MQYFTGLSKRTKKKAFVFFRVLFVLCCIFHSYLIMPAIDPNKYIKRRMWPISSTTAMLNCNSYLMQFNSLTLSFSLAKYIMSLTIGSNMIMTMLNIQLFYNNSARNYLGVMIKVWKCPCNEECVGCKLYVSQTPPSWSRMSERITLSSGVNMFFLFKIGGYLKIYPSNEHPKHCWKLLTIHTKNLLHVIWSE